MNDTELYLLHRQSTRTRAIPSSVLLLLLCAMLAFTLAFGLCGLCIPPMQLSVVSPIPFGDIRTFLPSLLRALMPTVAGLAILGVSVSSIAANAVAYGYALWHGLSLGTLTACLDRGFLIHAKTETIALFCALFAAVCTLWLAAYTMLYADCIRYTAAARETRYTAALLREYLFCFLTLAGAVLLCTVAALCLL